MAGSVLLCVCGGIAAYKAADLVRRLRDAGATVQVAMTENAQRFVGAQTFQALSGLPVRTSLVGCGRRSRRWATSNSRAGPTRILVAPATANTLAKLAHGFADDLVSTLCLATTAPITLRPAMNHRMWLHPATQANVALLRERGVRIVGPADGPLAEGESGPGRMVEPLDIVAALAEGDRLKPGRPPRRGQRGTDLRGPRSGPVPRQPQQREDGIRDRRRRRATRRGHRARRRPRAPADTRGRARASTCARAAQMHAAVLDALPADVYVGAAAVADFTPERMATSKIKKVPGEDALVLRLVRTPDILADVARDARRPRVVVGFAAETDDVATYARGKLDAKRIDIIAANRVGQAGSGFESDDNALIVYWRDAHSTLGERALGPAPKTALADALLDLVEERLHA